MHKTIAVDLHGCTVVFAVESMVADFVRFRIEFHFRMPGAALPPIDGCSLSQADLSRLLRSIQDWENADRASVFSAYDGFFTLELLEGGSARMMARYAPEFPVQLGIEGTVSDAAMASFRNGWLELLPNFGET